MTLPTLALDSSRFIQIQDDTTREVVRDLNTLVGAIKTGTVVSFAMTVPATLLTSTVTTSSGAVVATIGLTSQSANLAFLSPNGSSGVPSFRAIAGADLPASVYGTQTANYMFSGPTSGGAAAPSFRAMVVADLPAAVYGTQAANAVYVGPASGANAPPTFRALVAADIPSTLGSTAIGSGSTAITKVVAYAPNITPASVAANTTAEQTFTVTGLSTSDKLVINVVASMGAGLGVVGVRVSAADTLAITFSNNTAGALTPAAGVYPLLAFRT